MHARAAGPIPILLVAAVLLLAGPARGWGFGGYLEYLHADGFTKDDGETVDLFNNGFALGFVMDTNVARDSLFNYRLNVGFRYATGQYDFERNDYYETRGFVLRNTFGFGVLRRERVRLWLGPAMDIELNDREANFTRHDAVEARIAFGPELGVNWHVSDRVSLGLTAGYHYTFGSGTQTKEDYDDEDTCPADEKAPPSICLTLDLPDFNSYSIREHVVSVKLSVLFRTPGDVFRPRKR